MIAFLAFLLGLLIGSGLLLGSLAGYYLRLAHHSIAMLMAFGGGVLLCLITVELLENAFHEGGRSNGGRFFPGSLVAFLLIKPA